MMAARAMAKLGGMALLWIGLAACGDSEAPDAPSFDGVYKVASHTRSLGDCAKEGTPFAGDTYFRLTQEDGQLSYAPCDSAESCLEADSSRAFSHRVDSEWVGTQASGTNIRGGCTAQFGERIVSRLNGDNIQIEVRHYSGEFARDDGQECDAELVELNRAELACNQRDIVKATPVVAP